jgi:uncharacterized small protein (DUF1192 family)
MLPKQLEVDTPPLHSIFSEEEMDAMIVLMKDELARRAELERRKAIEAAGTEGDTGAVH